MQQNLSAIVQAERLSLFGHTTWMLDETDVKNILTVSHLRTWGDHQYIIILAYMDEDYLDLKCNILSLNEATGVAQNRLL